MYYHCKNTDYILPKQKISFSFIFNRSNLVVVGGTVEENVFSNKPNENEFRAILNRCKTLVPSLEVILYLNIKG
jgi:hypothetical protein